MKTRRWRTLWGWTGRVCGLIGLALIALWIIGPWYGRAAAATFNGHWAFSLNGGGAAVLYHPDSQFYAVVIPNSDGRPAVGLANAGPASAPKKPWTHPYKPFACSWWTLSPAERCWLPGGAPTWTRSTGLTLPLWFLGIPLCIAAGLIERRYRRSLQRERPGRCRGCDYDRAGLSADAECPECGKRP